VVINPTESAIIIGPGGKIIKKIEAETGAKLDIEQDGHVYITSLMPRRERAKKIVEDITKEFAWVRSTRAGSIASRPSVRSWRFSRTGTD